MKRCTVYWLRLNSFIDYNHDGYIGVTSDFKKRMHNHSCQPASPKLRNYINYYGWDNIIKEKLVEEVDEELAYLIEEMLRPEEGIGWNTTKGGQVPPDNSGKNHPNYGKRGEGTPMFNKKHTQEFKARMSGENNPMAGLKPEEYPSFKDSIIAVNLSTKESIELVGTKHIKAFGFDPACVYKCANRTPNFITHKQHKFYWKNEYILA